MLRIVILFVSLSIFSFDALFAQLADSPWPMRGQNPQRTGRSVSPYPTSNIVKWKYKTDGVVHSSPAIGPDGTVYVGSHDNYIYAINPDGVLKWRFLTDGWVRSSPAVDSSGTVYVGSYDNNLYAINPDGSLKWKYPTAGYIYSSPVIGQDGTIYVGSSDRRIYAVLPDGKLKWHWGTTVSINSSPSLGTDGMVYVCSNYRDLYKLDPDGKLKWHYRTSGAPSSPSIDSDGTIYIADSHGYLYAVNLDGSLKWSSKITPTAAILSSPSIGHDGAIYVGLRNTLFCIEPTGARRWHYTTGNFIDSTPAIGMNGTIYFGSWDRNLRALDPNGILKWEYTAGAEFCSSPAINSYGTLYVGSNDGYLYAFATSPVEDTGISETILVYKAIVYGMPLSEGDAVLVYDGSVCVGLEYFTGTYPMEITVWFENTGSDGAVLPGARFGNSMSFAIWQKSREICDNIVLSNFTAGQGIFGEPATVISLLEGSSYLTQTISISPHKMNLISFNVEVNDMKVQSLLSDIETLVLAQDEEGGFLIPSHGIDTIDTADVKKGYWLYYSSFKHEEFDAIGIPVKPARLSYSFDNSRMYILCCPYRVDADVTAAFESIRDKILIVMDDSGGFWIPEYGINTLNKLQPGKGYQILLDSPCEFTWPAVAIVPPAPKAVMISNPNHFEFHRTGIPFPVIVESSALALAIGDEIALYDNNICVGASVFEGLFPLVIAAWKGFPEFRLPGYNPGNRIEVRIWKSDENKEYRVDIGDERFERDPFATISLENRLNTSFDNLPTAYSLEQNQPNPFNPETLIKFSVPETGMVSIRIYDINGRLVRTLVDSEMSSGHHSIKWDGRNEGGELTATGVYFLTMRSIKFDKTIRMLLLK